MHRRRAGEGTSDPTSRTTGVQAPVSVDDMRRELVPSDIGGGLTRRQRLPSHAG
jgi:hypothetical protein